MNMKMGYCPPGKKGGKPKTAKSMKEMGKTMKVPMLGKAYGKKGKKK